ncbi:MAG: CHC2 zinc finger domain-containing protein [Paracoccaceae bacterium]|nr:CHC2 zinc finger domain-containing protein [Paracoccaceae bacterium]MDE2917877.1 CHC2 zinc finger domain-containing protein [Paracoccaceae bacterium]
MGKKSMDMKEQTAQLNKIPIQQVGYYLGLEIPLTGSTNCPFPNHIDKSPSFEIKQNTVRWICYACNICGGSIDFVKHMQGISFLEARKWLIKQTSNSSTHFPVHYRQPLRGNSSTVHPNKLDEPESIPDFELYAEFLDLCPLLSEGRSYLTSRCISEKSINHFRIGQIKDYGAIRTLIQIHGFDRVNLAGLLTKESTKNRFYSIFSPQSLLFPYLEDGQIVYYQSRNIAVQAHKGRWRNLNHRKKRRLFNPDVLDDPQKKKIAICEGVIDTISAHELVIPAIGLNGVSANFTHEEYIKLREKDSVLILLDWDDAGEKRSKKLLIDFQRYGISAIRKKCPSKTSKDLNDFLKEKRGY